MATDVDVGWPVKDVSAPTHTIPGSEERGRTCRLSRLTFASAQIVYTAIVGVVMLAAVLEWFLWIAAFMYCLVKVFQKAEHWTVRILSVVVGVAFLLLR